MKVTIFRCDDIVSVSMPYFSKCRLVLTKCFKNNVCLGCFRDVSKHVKEAKILKIRKKNCFHLSLPN